jgi:cyanophycinase
MHDQHRRRFLAALTATAAAPAALAQTANSPAQGIAVPTAVPIGGALRYDNDEVWSRLVALAGGPGVRFAIFATAAGNPERSAGLIARALQKHGARTEHIAVAPKLPGVDLAAAVKNPEWVDKVRACQGVYFSGGAQERIVDTLQPGGQATPLLQAVWEVFQRGGVVAGTSAGAAIMSSTMFRDAQDVMAAMKGPLRDGREVDRGLGFVGPGLFIDQHFLRRGRIGRMLPLMLARGYTLGLGVEENSAAIVRGTQVEVIGGRGALLADLSAASHDASLGAFNLKNAALTYLDRGDRYDLATRVLTPSAAKAADHRIDPNASDFKPFFTNRLFPLDMLGDATIANAMAHLLDSPQRELRGLAFNTLPAADDPAPELGFEFRLHKRADTHGWFTGSFGGEDYSVAHMGLDVVPVRVRQPLYTAWSR